MKTFCILACSFLFAAAAATPLAAQSDNDHWAERAADSAMARWPDGRFVAADAPWHWNYELGTLLEGMDGVWFSTADGADFKYIKSSVDQLVTPEGTIATLKADDHELDNILVGRQLLLLYRVTLDKRYLTAATFLNDQLAQQPRNADGGYWHKQRYPNQMWLDGLYMAEPFRAEYAFISHRPEDFKDVTHQFVLMEQHARDSKTGLLYHGWDASKQERWANKQTGDSTQFWARGIGWYMMALVDTLSYYPADDPGRKQLLAILNREAASVARYQDQKTGLWYTMMNKTGEKGNYFESSSACMFVYAFAKGVRRGYLPASYLANAERGYKGILSHFIKSNGADVSLTDTVKASGLGGNPYRDGSYAYYIGEKVVTNDPKGIGAFLLASAEMENAQNAKLGRGDTVVVDGWFNSQQRADAFGHQVYFHYKWDTLDEPGYSMLGHIFRNFGAQTRELDAEPTVANLHGAQVYVIASPDNADKNPQPHYATAADATLIADWVRAGGVLMIMENDTSFADLDHFNAVSEKFGIHFNSVLRKHVIGRQWELGKIAIDPTGPIFHNAHTIYVKDVCTISVSGPAHAVLKEGDDIFMAMAKYGKGTVYAMVDPWLYNEYTDGRKLPGAYDNYAAGKELVRWVLAQVPR
ncbi:Glycosyl hydrolase family 88 [Candidatus Sulfotelmatomonas gaucii]|uniref:Glycosyl hydrolase family 88 n=1 Tax=Candidatus Sulfuritelmatomonas gaucii TaxID=2043161 RepID=A0A2N9LQ79_9BACT|nr:Glycosyl hydrolase family 88 [Candidatus Sulfotelmatomonas gaucii]